MQPGQTEHACPGTYGLTQPGRGCRGQDVCGALVNPTCLQNNSRRCLSLGCSPLPHSIRLWGWRAGFLVPLQMKPPPPKEQVRRAGPKQTRTFSPESEGHIRVERFLSTPRGPSRLCGPCLRSRGPVGSRVGHSLTWASLVTPILSCLETLLFSALKLLPFLLMAALQCAQEAEDHPARVIYPGAPWGQTSGVGGAP